MARDLSEHSKFDEMVAQYAASAPRAESTTPEEPVDDLGLFDDFDFNAAPEPKHSVEPDAEVTGTSFDAAHETETVETQDNSHGVGDDVELLLDEQPHDDASGKETYQRQTVSRKDTAERYVVALHDNLAYRDMRHASRQWLTDLLDELYTHEDNPARLPVVEPAVESLDVLNIALQKKTLRDLQLVHLADDATDGNPVDGLQVDDMVYHFYQGDKSLSLRLDVFDDTKNPIVGYTVTTNLQCGMSCEICRDFLVEHKVHGHQRHTEVTFFEAGNHPPFAVLHVFGHHYNKDDQVSVRSSCILDE